MATKALTFTVKDDKTAIASWLAITENDTGSPVSLVKYPGRTVQIIGNFGTSGAVTLEGSNDGTTFSTLHQANGASLVITNNSLYIIAENPDQIRPRATAGTGMSVTVYVTGGNSLSGGSTISLSGGDASAANQTLQITQETAINSVLGTAVASPSSNTIADRLKTINTTLGSPFQAGGSVGVTGSVAVTGTFFQATQPVSGTVAISSVIPGSGATNLGKAEDGAHTSGDIGVFGLALANEAQTVLAQDGDYIGHGADTKGNTFVTGPVASATADAGNPVKIGGKYNSTVQAFTNGNRVDLQVDQRGGLLLQDGQAIASVSVTSATTLFTIADTSGYGSISTQITSAGSATITYEASEDGTTWVATAGYNPASAGTAVSVTTSTTATQLIFPLLSKQFRARVSAYTSGTVTVQGTLKKDTIARNSVAIGNNVAVVGIVGDTGTVAANAIPTLYEGRTTNKTAVTTGQYVRPIATSIGAVVNKPFQVPELDWSYPAAAGGISNTTTAVTMVAAAGAGIRNYLTAIQVSAGALGAASEIAVRDGAGGTVIWRGFLSTAGGNQSVNLSSPIKSTANTLLEVVTLTATITGAVYINAQGYQAP